MMAVARKINNQKDSNSIYRTSPEPHIPDSFGVWRAGAGSERLVVWVLFSVPHSLSH